MNGEELNQAIEDAARRLRNLPAELLVATKRSAGDLRDLADQLRRIANELDAHIVTLQEPAKGA